jgi:fumarate reductase flavoprotein subunit
VVIGGGVAGLSAAIEAAPAGRVILLEADPQHLGGSAWWGQAATALPSAEQWPGSAPARVRYRDRVVPDVIDWTEAMGLSWLDLPGAEVTLRAPVGGGRRLTDALWRTAAEKGVEIVLGATVTDLSTSLRVTTAAGDHHQADAIILASGGWAADLPGVRAALSVPPERPLLNGALPSSQGAGLALADTVGAARHSPPQVILYGHGTPDPQDPERALVLLGAERTFLIDTTGQPQPWLQDVRGETGGRLMALPEGRAWAILDGQTLRMLRLQGSGVERHVPAQVAASQTGHVAPTLPLLAEALGLPSSALEAGLAVEGVTTATPLLPQGPYAALPLVPMTAKSISGLETDASGRVLDASGAPIAGLYAAGEVMGFGHPYDGAVLDSTMVAGAILTGRVAGATVHADLSK